MSAMLPEEIDALPAGRELDILIAEKVFEAPVDREQMLWRFRGSSGYTNEWWDPLPLFSTDVMAGEWVRMWARRLGVKTDGLDLLSVCRAALKAVSL